MVRVDMCYSNFKHRGGVSRLGGREVDSQKGKAQLTKLFCARGGLVEN